jgi:hypothetical protein
MDWVNCAAPLWTSRAMLFASSEPERLESEGPSATRVASKSLRRRVAESRAMALPRARCAASQPPPRMPKRPTTKVGIAHEGIGRSWNVRSINSRTSHEIMGSVTAATSVANAAIGRAATVAGRWQRALLRRRTKAAARLKVPSLARLPSAPMQGRVPNRELSGSEAGIRRCQTRRLARPGSGRSRFVRWRRVPLRSRGGTPRHPRQWRRERPAVRAAWTGLLAGGLGCS